MEEMRCRGKSRVIERFVVSPLTIRRSALNGVETGMLWVFVGQSIQHAVWACIILS